jgi:hypothetical protein
MSEAMTNDFVEVTLLTNAGRAEMRVLSEAELNAVAGGLDAKNVLIINWVYKNFPSLLPAVFTQGTRNVC